MRPDSIRVALFGECMIELQGDGSGLMRQSFGGDTLNMAIYLARCGRARGISVSYASALGEDRFSDAMLAAWAAEGIGCELVRRLPDRLPGLYTIQVDVHGERQFSYWRENSAARAYFDAAQTPLEAAAAQLQALVVSGISLAILAPAARARLFETMRRVRAHGGRVVFDSNYRPQLWPAVASARAAHAEALALADIALLTLDDEQRLHGDATAEAALQRALALDCAELVVKRGRAPTLVRAFSEVLEVLHEVPTLGVDRVVDTTAAGDSFAGAYLATRLAGATAPVAAAAGNRLAATVIQHRGAIIPRGAMPAM